MVDHTQTELIFVVNMVDSRVSRQDEQTQTHMDVEEVTAALFTENVIQIMQDRMSKDTSSRPKNLEFWALRDLELIMPV